MNKEITNPVEMLQGQIDGILACYWRPSRAADFNRIYRTAVSFFDGMGTVDIGPYKVTCRPVRGSREVEVVIQLPVGDAHIVYYPNTDSLTVVVKRGESDQDHYIALSRGMNAGGTVMWYETERRSTCINNVVQVGLVATQWIPLAHQVLHVLQANMLHLNSNTSQPQVERAFWLLEKYLGQPSLPLIRKLVRPLAAALKDKYELIEFFDLLAGELSDYGSSDPLGEAYALFLQFSDTVSLLKRYGH